MLSRRNTILVVLATTAVLSGCTVTKDWFHRDTGSPPMLTNPNPTLADITSSIHRNSMMIRTMSSEDASITVPGVLWPVRSRLTFERPKRLRIQGGATTLTGQELDFGSNDTLFWLWVRRLPEKELYYCRHDQFPTCPARSMVPIEPNWIVEAIGIIEFSPSEQHEGPIPVGNGNLEILSRRQTASGQYLKKTIVDGKTGWVLRQEMYSPQNELVALAISSDHRYDKGTGIHYAKRIEVQCRGAEGKMSIDLGTPTFNAATPISSGMFTMPTYDGYRPVDICGPEFLQHRVGIAVPESPPNASPTSTAYAASPAPPAAIPEETLRPAPYYGAVTSEASLETVIR